MSATNATGTAERGTAQQDSIESKTLELCQTILEEPNFQEHRKRIDAFMADQDAKAQYQTVVEKGEALNHKQQMGQSLSDEEIQDFEQHRQALDENPVTRDFLQAQREMQQVQQSINQYLSKTFELGRLPTQDDLSGGCCGESGCGCH